MLPSLAFPFSGLIISDLDLRCWSPPAPSLHPCHQGAACSHAQAGGRKSERYVSRGNRLPNSSIPVVEPFSQTTNFCSKRCTRKTMWRPVHYRLRASCAYLLRPALPWSRRRADKKRRGRADGARKSKSPQNGQDDSSLPRGHKWVLSSHATRAHTACHCVSARIWS